MARLTVVLSVPIVGELDQRRLAVGWAVGNQVAVLWCGEEDQRVPRLLIDSAAYFGETKLVAIEIESGVEIAHAQHRVQIAHDGTSVGVGSSVSSRLFMTMRRGYEE